MFIDFFWNELTQDMGRHPKEITPDALFLLRKYQWPGNVRELKNLLERLIIMTPGDKITEKDLPDYIREEDKKAYYQGSFASNSLKEARKRFEREFILRSLEENRWNISKTADTIGVERTSLYRKIKSYDLERKNIG